MNTSSDKTHPTVAAPHDAKNTAPYRNPNPSREIGQAWEILSHKHRNNPGNWLRANQKSNTSPTVFNFLTEFGNPVVSINSENPDLKPEQGERRSVGFESALGSITWSAD